MITVVLLVNTHVGQAKSVILHNVIKEALAYGQLEATLGISQATSTDFTCSFIKYLFQKRLILFGVKIC